MELFTKINPVVIIPTYNNEKTISDVITQVKNYTTNIIVVNDGSTDSTPDIIHSISAIHLIEFSENKGKGAALQAAFALAIENAFTHAIAFDADGQHLAEDIPLFLKKMDEEPDTLWIGDRVLEVKDGVEQPPRSRFGRRFGAFWYRFFTGVYIRDTQCGLRAYPLAKIDALECHSPRYEYEIELLIAAAWNDVPVKSVQVHLLYHSPQERVSHFRPIRDFIRISKINSKAAIARLFLPAHVRKVKGLSITQKVKSFIKHELKANASPVRAAISLSSGVFMGLTPFHGLQVVLMFVLTLIVRLNRPLALLGIAVSSPPLIPFWLIAGLGTGKLFISPKVAFNFALILRKWLPSMWASSVIDFLRGWMPKSMDIQSSIHEFAIGIVQWFFGSFILAVVCGVLTFAIALPIFRNLRLQDDKKS